MITRIFKYISQIVCMLFFTACSYQDLTPVGPEKNSIEFIFRPNAFLTTDVTSKALDDSELSAAENTIYTGYFILFDNNGSRVMLKDVGTGLSYKYNPADNSDKAYAGLAGFNACFVANVPYSFINNNSKANEGDETTTDLQKLQNAVLKLTYAEHSGDDGTGYIGIPNLILDLDRNGIDDTSKQCMPMFGITTLTKQTLSSYKVTIPIERLLAKINLTIKMDLSSKIDGWTQLIEGEANFMLTSYTLVNLPMKVNLQTQLTDDGNYIESEWGDTDFYTNIKTTDINVKNGGDGVTITSYIPEYFVDSTGVNTYQELKPSFVAEGKKPVCFIINGVFTHPYLEDGEYIDFEYRIYLGEDIYDSFSLKRNRQYNLSMTIEGIDQARLETDQRVTADIPVTNLADPGNTGKEESANCYIISTPGRYMIPAVKGNKLDQKLTGLKISDEDDIQYTDNSANVISNLKSVTENGKEYIRFDVNMATLEAVKNGNTILLAKDAYDNVLWSWHLWFCENNNRPDYDAVLEKYPKDNGEFNGKLVMNRALGATTSTGLDLTAFGGSDYSLWKNGLYYQWGRKDPLFINNTTTTGSGGTYQNSISNPNVFYTDWTGNDSNAGWANEKSINDPCPPGYKVPSSEVWRTSNPDADYSISVAGLTYKSTNDDRYTYNLTRSNSDDSSSMFIYFNYGGTYNSSGDKLDQITTSLQSTTNENYVYSEELPTKDQTTTGYLLSPVQYRLITYSFDQTTNHSALWANDKKCLQYGYSSIDGNSDSFLGSLLSTIPILKCKRRSGVPSNYTKTTTGTYIKIDKYTYHSSDVNWEEWEDVGNSKLGLTEKWNLSQYLKNTYFKAIGNVDGYVYNITESEILSEAYQIRCVKK